MAEDKTEEKTESAPEKIQVLLAFRLGWTTAELLGRLRKGVRPAQRVARGDDYAPRLSVSDGRLSTKGQEFWLAARRLVDLGKALALWPEDKWPWSPHPVQGLPKAIKRWLEGASVPDMTPAALRELLDAWSLDVWSRLQAQDDTLARAFTAGMSLADTFWYLRPPGRAASQDIRLAQEDWRRLLSIYRMDVERGRLQDLADELPSGVSDVLRHHLRNWSIGTELYYDDEDQLKRLAWPYRRSHPLGWLYRWRRVKRSPELQPADERAIQDALERQAEIWQTLVFGQRTPEGYLYARERQWVVWLARLGLVVLLLLLVGLPAVALVFAFSWLLGGAVVPGIMDVVQETTTKSTASDWNDLFTLLSSLAAAVGALVVGIRSLFRWLPNVYGKMRHELTVLLVAWRTSIPWDRELRKKVR